MMVLVCYDVETLESSGQRRLAKIARICKNYGQRVQYSLFECLVTPDQWENLKSKLLDNYEPKNDSLRFYFLGSNWERRIEHHGAKPSLDTDGTIIL